MVCRLPFFYPIGGLCVSFRTDCCFSPDDKLLVTGTSVRKGEGHGKLVFFDRGTFQKVYNIDVTNAVSTRLYIYTNSDTHTQIKRKLLLTQ